MIAALMAAVEASGSRGLPRLRFFTFTLLGAPGQFQGGHGSAKPAADNQVVIIESHRHRLVLNNLY
jgi:hypothetical protein